MISRLCFFSIGLIPEPSEWYYPRYSHSGHRGTLGRYFKYQNLSKYNRERKRRTKWNTTHSSSFFQEEVSLSVEDLPKCEEKEEVTSQKGKKTEGERFVGTKEWNDRVPELMTTSHTRENKKPKKEKQNKPKKEYMKNRTKGADVRKRKMRTSRWKKKIKDDKDTACTLEIWFRQLKGLSTLLL